MLLRGVELSRGGLGEPAVADTSGRPRVGGQIPGERDTERGLPQRLSEFSDNLSGRIAQTIEDAQQSRSHVLAARPTRRWVMTGEPEKVVSLIEREMEALRDRRDHLLGRLRPALPFQPRVVVGRHVAEPGHLLPPQPARPAALSTWKADVLGLQRLPTAPEEPRQSCPVDLHGYLFPSSPFLRLARCTFTAWRSPLLDSVIRDGQA